jgi:hypothetical protein
MKIIRFYALFLFVLSAHFSISQAITTIAGFAPHYVGKEIVVCEIQDYFSLRENVLARTTVKADSTFSLSFYANSIQKVIVRCEKNSGFMYIQPQAIYSVFFPQKNKYDVYNPNGNQVEITFFDLKEDDINYKILSLDKWINKFLGTFFYRKNLGVEFAKNLDTFKLNVEKAYEDDTNFFFKTYVRFSIASLDDINYKGSRNRYEKYDFYVQNFPVSYKNEAYMTYINTFYENLIPRLAMETNNKVYLGLLKNSPTLIMRALENEYTLKGKNIRLRELIMIKSLSDAYFSGDLPQTNILSVLDSVSKHSFFKENGIVASNLIFRLTELLQGSKAPDFVIKNGVEVLTLNDFQKKHLYIQFVDLNLKDSWKEIELLKPIYQRYSNEVNVLTVYISNIELSKKQKEILKNLPWKHVSIESNHDLLTSYQVNAYPHYVLLDPIGYVVNAPALKPSPNGQYETIDKIFFQIRKAKKEH